MYNTNVWKRYCLNSYFNFGKDELIHLDLGYIDLLSNTRSQKTLLNWINTTYCTVWNINLRPNSGDPVISRPNGLVKLAYKSV